MKRICMYVYKSTYTYCIYFKILGSMKYPRRDAISVSCNWICEKTTMLYISYLDDLENI